MMTPGTRIGAYEILHNWRGRHGLVYWAADTKLGREVALKILPGAVTADPFKSGTPRVLFEVRFGRTGSPTAYDVSRSARVRRQDGAESKSVISSRDLRGAPDIATASLGQCRVRLQP